MILFHLIRAYMSSLSDPKWWKKTLKSIKSVDDGQNEEVDEGMNEDLARQGVHPFYAAVVEGAFIDKVIDHEKSHFNHLAG